MKKLIAIIIAATLCGCSSQSSVTGADGQSYVLVKKADSSIGVVANAELWQRAGETGEGKPFYTRRLQASTDTSSPIFTQIR